MKGTGKKISLLSKWKEKKEKQHNSGLKPVPKNALIPLSKEQQRLWFLQQLHPDNSFYNYSELYRLTGSLDINAFEKSIRSIEQNHDILRSNFIMQDHAPIVQINSQLRSDFHYHDLSSESIEVAEEKAEEIVHTTSRYVFNLSSEALLKSVVIKVSEGNFLFLIVMHHIITDKWSMRVFRHELASNYKLIVSGNPLRNDKSEIQYASYAQWQQNNKINEQHLEYWKKKLSGKVPELNLPTDFSKRLQPRYAGTFHKQVYNDQIANSFSELCKKLEATPYILMLSVYYVLLQKYSDQEDIFIGTPITKRDHVSLEKLIGFFNDTLVLRTNVDKTLRFSELVKKVKQTTLEAFSNKDISFDTLVKELKPDRSLNINPFFRVMFLYHQVPETPVLSEDIKIDYEPYDAGVSKFDLTLYISDDKGALTSLMEYDTDLFEAQTIARMHEHFKILLENCIKQPDTLLSDLEMLTQEEITYYNKPLLNLDNRTIKNGIHDIIANYAITHSNSIAVRFKENSLTYKELNDQANKVACILLDNGLKSNDIVGLCIERSQNVIIGLLGILKAGGAYLPLDPAYPSDRITYIMENTEAKVILTEVDFLSDFSNSNIKAFSIDTVLNQKGNIDNITLPKTEPTDLAYVIYTSGSTGKPKGVPITHKNIINSTLSRTNFYEQDPSAFLLMSSISFDSSKVGVFWTLCFGGTLVISEKHLEQDLEKMTTIIDAYQISHTLMLPSLYSNLLEYGDPKRLSSLHTVMVAGESCSTKLVQQHFKILPEVHLYNEYGPTEATVWCTAHKIKPTDALLRSVPIGVPTANAAIYILNDLLEKVPFGSTGELYIGGIGLTKGYINRSEGDFIQNPFSNNTDDKLYKTGDLARFRGDGTIEFLGRKDKQVKIRGYRIELDEIEQVLQSHENVTQAAIAISYDANVSFDDENLEKNPMALAQLLEDNLSKEELNSWLDSIEDLEQEDVKYMITMME